MDLGRLKTDLEAVARKVLKRTLKVEQGEISDTEGEPVEGLTVDSSLLIFPAKLTQMGLTGKPFVVTEVAIDKLIGGDGQFEAPDVERHPSEGHTFNETDAIAEVIAILAREDAHGHLEAESQLTPDIGYCPPECKDGDRDLCRTCLVKEQEAKPKLVKLPKHTMSIVIQQVTTCKACDGKMPKGSHGWWARTDKDNKGGLYHKDCAEVELT